MVARCYSAPPPFRQSRVDDEENALVVLIVVLKMWIEGSVQDHHAEEGFRLVDHHFRDKLVSLLTHCRIPRWSIKKVLAKRFRTL